MALLRRAADLISERSNELAALMAMEVGKNRLEALGDVEESADLIRYYCQQLEDNDGFARKMGQLSANEHTRSVLKPYGVWAVISPFNFPMALAAGPAGGALVAGNTVVLKPSPQGSFTGYKLYECLRDAGLPAGVFHFLPGGDEVGKLVVAHEDVDGITFTGSYAVGMKIYKEFSKGVPRPAVCEMGGKNPAIVSAKADLDLAAEGVLRSAFGFSGQKCSACSRVYVERAVAGEFAGRLADRAAQLRVGDPLDREVYMGPVIDDEAVDRFKGAVKEARKEGRVLAGGEVLSGRPAQGQLRRPDGGRRPAARPPAVQGRAVRAVRGRGPGRLAGRGPGAGQRHRVRPDGRLLLQPTRPRSTSSWTGSRPGSSTSTARPGPPPAPGRACSRSAAGRGRAAPARPAAASTTSSSSCASSPRR